MSSVPELFFYITRRKKSAVEAEVRAQFEWPAGPPGFDPDDFDLDPDTVSGYALHAVAKHPYDDPEPEPMFLEKLPGHSSSQPTKAASSHALRAWVVKSYQVPPANPRTCRVPFVRLVFTLHPRSTWY